MAAELRAWTVVRYPNRAAELAKMTRVGPVAQLVRAGDSSTMVPSHRKVRSGRDEFRETLTVHADGNPEPSRRYTAGRCRDYLSATVALNDRLERPAPHRGEEIVHSHRKRRERSESLGPRFESERAHHFSPRRRRRDDDGRCQIARPVAIVVRSAAFEYQGTERARAQPEHL